MALTKDELLEMINSTISSNGTKAITGDALNAALTAIVEMFSDYVFPNMWEALDTGERYYVFTNEEAAAFRTAWANRYTTTFVANGSYGGAEEFECKCAWSLWKEYTDDGYDVYVFHPAASQGFWDNIIFTEFCVEDNGDELRAYYW